METWVAIAVAVIGAIGMAGGPIAVVLIQKSRKEQAEFREENDLQHGRSMAAIREIQLTTRETAADLRELRQDFDDHLDEHLNGVLEDDSL